MSNKYGCFIKLTDTEGEFEVSFDAMFLLVEISTPLVGSLALDYTPKNQPENKSKDASRFPLPIPPWVIPSGSIGKVYAPRLAVDAGQVRYILSNSADSDSATVIYLSR